MKDGIVYKAALTCSHKELAGMYALCNKREEDLKQAIKALKKAFILLPVNGASEPLLTLTQFTDIMEKHKL